MNICGIVCEYNPFHNGHLYQIEETRRREADGIICVMSGNFVQRGDFAIMPKTARAASAVRSGADVVIELPVPWAISSAERFAAGAVSVLDALGVVSSISFGAECADKKKLLRIAKIFTDKDFDAKIMEEYSSGISFAAARERALAKVDSSLSPLIAEANNILAIEYLKAITRLNSPIHPIVIERTGASHDSTQASESIASASYIRELISRGEDFSKFVPRSSAMLFEEEAEKGTAPVFSSVADRAIMSVLKRLTPEDFAKYGDVSEGLEFRLFDAVEKSHSVADAVDLVKTKRYAHARIRRIFLNAFLDTDSSLSLGHVPYARILAFNDRGREIIKKAKKLSKIPVITRPSSIKNEDERLQALFALERRADDIYSLFMKAPISQGSTFTQSPIYIED